MSDTLEIIQSDVYALLNAVPSLDAAFLIKQDENDLESKVKQKINTANPKTGKSGLIALVLFPDVADTEQNLPGPPVNVSIRIQTIEQVTLNRSANGTGLRSSEAALNILRSLHQHHAGSYIIYADKNPVRLVNVVDGFSSHSVNLIARYQIDPIAKCGAVQAELSGSNVALTTSTSGAEIYYTTNGNYPAEGVSGATLYTVPIAGLSTGTTLRAAAYKSPLNPSDVERIVYTS